MMEDPQLYRIRRFFHSRTNVLVDGKTGLTLAEAQSHCSDPETSSSTCTESAGKELTKLYGPWFDGYERDPG